VLSHSAYRTGKSLAIPPMELNLAHGSLLVMEGSTQHTWFHSVPKAQSLTAGRINLTFRSVLDEFADDGNGEP